MTSDQKTQNANQVGNLKTYKNIYQRFLKTFLNYLDLAMTNPTDQGCAGKVCSKRVAGHVTQVSNMYILHNQVLKWEDDRLKDAVRAQNVSFTAAFLSKIEIKDPVQPQLFQKHPCSSITIRVCYNRYTPSSLFVTHINKTSNSE